MWQGSPSSQGLLSGTLVGELVPVSHTDMRLE